MKAKKNLRKVYVKGQHLLDLIHWARRYADRRCTWVPNDFNRIYDEIMTEYPFLKDHEFKDETLSENGMYFPHAKDGNFSGIDVGIQSRCS